MTVASHLDEHRAYIGASGSGKSTTARADVEQLLRDNRHTVVIDHTGIWYGLRSNAAGTGPGFDIPIFGGRRGDVAIAAGDGDAIGRIVGGEGVSAIVDLSGLRSGPEQRAFMADFVAAIRRKPPGHFQYVNDEADEDVPEKVRDDVGFRLQEDMIWMAKRGRSDGFVLSLITQRPAAIAKEALSQAQTIFAHQLTAPTDTQAFGRYVRAHGTKAEHDEIMARLPSLQVGERYLYRPRDHVLELARTQLPATFDSSRTPGPGEARREPRMLNQIDVSAIAKVLAKPMVDEAVEASAAGVEAGKLLVDRDAEIVQLKSELEQSQHHAAELLRGIRGAYDLLRPAVVYGDRPRTQSSDGEDRVSPVSASAVAGQGEAAPGHAAAAPASPKTKSALIGAERKPLAYLAGVAPAGLTEVDWAGLSGFKRKGGTWGTYKSRLRTAGLIEQRDDLWHATPAGVAAIGADVVSLPSPGPDRAELWAARIPGVARMIDVLVKRHPHFTTRDALASDLNMVAAGGTFGTYLSRLRANALLEEKGKRLRLAATVMGQQP